MWRIVGSTFDSRSACLCKRVNWQLGFLPGLTLEHVEALRLPPPQRAHKALDRVVAVRKAEPLDQILVDRLGVAPKLLLDPAAVHLAGRAGERSRWPGWWGILTARDRALAAV